MDRILVVEDEKEIQSFIKECLETNNYEVEVADDGIEAMEKFQKTSLDLILLDVMLPKLDGFSVCELIRLESNIPIIMLTALTEEEHQIKGFDVLVDDYILKPFSYGILLKRIEAALRKRNETNHQSAILRLGKLRLNLDAYEVFIDKESIILTGIEFNILKYLLLNKNQVLSREQIMEAVWGIDCYDNSEQLVNHHIMNIRKKIKVNYIETIRGVGYRIAEKNQP